MGAWKNRVCQLAVGAVWLEKSFQAKKFQGNEETTSRPVLTLHCIYCVLEGVTRYEQDSYIGIKLGAQFYSTAVLKEELFPSPFFAAPKLLG